MSIIYDALKKIQDDRNTSKSFLESIKHNLIEIILALIILALMATVIILYLQRQPHVSPIPHPKRNVVVKKAITLPVDHISFQFDANAFRIKHNLKGVFISGEEKVAMINNQFFHVGDEIDGMQIKNMDLEHVFLEKDTHKVELRVMS